VQRYWIISVVFLMVGCANLPESPTLDKNRDKLPDQTISQGKIDVVKEGRLQYVIHAGRIRTFEKDRLTLLDSSVVVDFFNQAGAHTSVLTSAQARVEETKNIFLAQGNVVVKTDSGATLRTERLFWDEAKRKIRSDTLVTMITQYDSLRGYNFDAAEDLSSWQIQQPTGQTMREFGK
jgi:LPS export ABC transporter protein LptC